MAFIIDSDKLLFILNPRTASTAIASHLGNSREGGRWIPKEDIQHEDGTIKIQRKHSTIKDLLESGIISQEYLDSLITFSVVRNPFDSLVSLWTKKKFVYAELAKSDNFFGNKIPDFNSDMEFIQKNSFSDWVLKVFIPKYDPKVAHSINKKYISGVNHILKFENLQSDFNSLMSKLEISIPDIPILNKTENKDDNWRKYYTPASREMVAKYFSLDLENFDYSFD